MNDTEKRKLETELIRAGFKGFSDPSLIPILARLVENHEMLRALLNDCTRLERYQMLEALRAHLPFTPKTVEEYESMTAEKFERYESERNRVIAGDREFEKVAKELSTHVLITLKCSKCQKNTANFAGETPLGAVILARQDGWVRDKFTNKEVCPKCPSEFRSKRRKCPGCQRRHFAPDCRVVGKIEPGAPLIGGAKKGELDISTMKVQ